MADDINPGRRKELVAAIAVLDPQIRGLGDIANDPISDELRNLINIEISNRTHRRGLLQQELDAMDAVNVAHDGLLADGYPDLPPVNISAELFKELKGDVSDVESGASVFSQATASTMQVNLGEFADNPSTTAASAKRK